jgi:hypothetical protein
MVNLSHYSSHIRSRATHIQTIIYVDFIVYFVGQDSTVGRESNVLPTELTWPPIQHLNVDIFKVNQTKPKTLKI